MDEHTAPGAAPSWPEQQLIDAPRVAHLGSWEWDVVADEITWEAEVNRIFGLRPDELEPTYDGFLAHVHPADHTLVNDRIAATFRTSEPFEAEYRVLRPNGETRWVRAGAELVRDDDGEPLLMRGTVLDIDEAKRTEDRLRRTTARYRLLRTIASAANQVSDLRTALQTAVREICTHTGWQVGHVFLPDDDDPEVLVPTDIWHLVDPDRFQVLHQVTMRTRFRAGESIVGGLLVPGARPASCIPDVTKDPSHVRASTTGGLGIRGHVAFSVRLVDEPVAVLEFFTTAPVEADDALLETLGEVGAQLGRVAERERADAALAAARDAAMEASRLKSEFLATMSHEIRTPMNGVIGLTGLLLATDLDDRQRQYAEGVEQAGEALMAIISDILDFSKIEAGKLELEHLDFDLVDVVEGTAGLVADSARRKGLELIAYCTPDVPRGLRGDPSRLRQVLLNLAVNAIKFTEGGEVVIRARLADPSADGDPDGTAFVRFEVTDTGTGIAVEDQQRLFNAFTQADTSTTRRFGGTGLGLAISSQLVEAMGGQLDVDSTLGEGSTFRFTLPFRAPIDATAVSDRPAPHTLRDLPVLIVDDNATNRLILREQLRAWDVDPDVVEGGVPALQILDRAAREGRPHALAILDMCMEGMDGLELARRISSDARFSAMRMLLLTSTPDISPLEAAQAGIAVTLMKPVRLSQLYDALMRLTAPAATISKQAPPAVTANPSQGRILVVEDNEINQMVAIGVLEQLDYDGDVAANGLEALEALERTDYAAVLMDCQMPEMDGYTATAEIRRRPWQARDIPIIAMTAGAVEGDRERCLAAGMDDYLAKPVIPADVDAALSRWVGHVRGVSDPAIIDPDRIAMLRQMGSADGSLLARLVAVFTDQSTGIISSIGEAASAGDVSALREGVHKLRGGAANLGATALAAACAEIEDLEEVAPGITGPLVDRVREALDQTVRALRAAVETGGA